MIPRSVSLLVVSLLAAANPSTGEARQPSVVVILADDQGWGDVSLHGNRNLATPTLDRLAQAGARFERFYVQPVCSPTRAEALTGRYHPRDGVRGVTNGGERFAPDTPTLANLFRQAGYATAAFGKWHSGTQAPYHPLCRGFDEFYGFTAGHWANYFSPLVDHNGKLTTGEGYLTDDLTTRAIEFLQEQGDRPSFVWLAFNTPHSPMQVPDEWWDRHAEQTLDQRGALAKREKIDHTRAALAMVENIDWNVGRLLDAIDQSGDAEETIVVYFTDNGPNGHRFNGNMRGIKGSTDEGGVRSPLFVRWPGHIAPGTVVKDPTAAIDLLPTLAELTTAPRPDGPPRDGRSLAPRLLGDTTPAATRTLFTHWNGRLAARRGSLLLSERGELFDLATDPNQLKNIAADRPDATERLASEIARWKADVGLQQLDGRRPFTVGHPALPDTQLPARDARTRGGVVHSSRHHNCTYLTNWTSTDDQAYWPAEVVEGGRYRVTLHYTCPADSVGSLIEARFGDQSCQAQLTAAHDPPLHAAQHDRFPRTEGDTKPFATLDLGELILSPGEGELTIRARESPGPVVMDLRLVVLTRTD